MEIALRQLEQKDAPRMLEWMHTQTVVQYMAANFCDKKLEDCQRFIAQSRTVGADVHLAAVDSRDEYLGTVSLKHLNAEHKTAEFAIIMRKCAMGTGASGQAMRMILQYGKEQLDLQAIYWCVNRNNIRAVRFYDKNGYQRIWEVPEHILTAYDQKMLDGLLWYVYE